MRQVHKLLHVCIQEGLRELKAQMRPLDGKVPSVIHCISNEDRIQHQHHIDLWKALMDGNAARGDRIIDKRFQRVSRANLTHRFRVPAHPPGNVEHSVRPIEVLDRILSVAECSHHLIQLPAHITALSG